jgi:hypothetical protein
VLLVADTICLLFLFPAPPQVIPSSKVVGDLAHPKASSPESN